MNGRKRKSGRRIGGFSTGVLMRQTLICILIILLVIAAKKMDSAIIKQGLAFFETQLAKDYTAQEILTTAKGAVSALRPGDEDKDLILPTDLEASVTTSSGAPGGAVISFRSDEEIQVHAAGGGTVTTVLGSKPEGVRVEISHGDGMVSVYSGLSAVYVKPLEKVRKGQIIASVGPGGTGGLSFELKIDGKAVNPMDYVQE